MGHHREALPLLQRSAKLHETWMGPKHGETASAIVRLGQALGGAGKRQKALPLLQKAHRIKETALGPLHVDTLACGAALAECLAGMGRDKDALPLLMDVRAGRRVDKVCYVQMH